MGAVTNGVSGGRVDPALSDTQARADRSATGSSPLDRLLASPDTLSRFGPGSNVHVVKPGETLSGIAAENGTSVHKLAEINGIGNPDLIRVGQHIRLPAASAPATHEVRRGETLSGIAAASGTSVSALAARNGIANPNRIMPGQQLVIPGASQGSRNAGANSPRVVPHTAPQAPAARSSTPTTVAPAQAQRTGGVPQPGAASIKAADLAAERATGHRSEGHCYAWVKTALQRSGAVNDYIPGVPAKDAGPALERRGFTNILSQPGANIRSPYDAPKGAVLVYGAAPGAIDRNAQYGHIEIRTDRGFASDYASPNARTGPAANELTGKNRVLIGVYVKPDAVATTAPARTEAPRVQTTAQTQAPAQAQGGSTLDVNHRELARVLGMGEGNYESYNTGTLHVRGGHVGHSYPNPPAGTVTNKTINEVLATSTMSGTNPDRLFAVGAYQITHKTLRGAVQAMHLTGNERLTPAMQDRIFVEYLVPTAGNGALGRYVANGAGTADQAQVAAARQWASIGVPAGLHTETGRVSDGTMTYYDKGPANHASVKATQALHSFLQNLRH